MTELQLKTPITTLGGATVSTLTLSFDGLRAKDYRQIAQLESKLKGERFSMDLSKKTSPEFRIATGWIAAVKGTAGLCIDDLDSLSLPDLLDVEQEASFFIAGVE